MYNNYAFFQFTFLEIKMFKELLIGITVILALIYTIIGAVYRLSTPGELAEIEQLRSDAVKISAQESEDVIGQVTKRNQDIVATKLYNKLWWSDPLIPDVWDDVRVIELPTR